MALMTPSQGKILTWIFFLGASSIGVAIFKYGWVETWSTLFVPALDPPFADLRTVQGALLSLERGLDPLVSNPGDPWGRPMNYPRLWLFIAQWLSLKIEIYYLISVLFYVVGYLCICAYLLNRFRSIWLLLAVLSGASLLSIERGNNDLVIFILLFFAATSKVFISVVLITIATILKIYPFFALISLIKRTKIFTVVSSILVLYLLSQYSDLIAMMKGNTSSISLSYGAVSTSWYLQKNINLFSLISSQILSWLLTLGLLIPALLLDRYKLKSSFLREDYFSISFEKKLFLIGAVIYLGTFVISSNWDYRLIFLIFCIPCILNMTQRFFKIVSLSSIVLASNQLVLQAILGSFLGELICVVAKVTVYISLVLMCRYGWSAGRPLARD
jgi:hypothetical protein